MLHVLFVCLGNICRSPAAEMIFKKHFSPSEISFDSAGILGIHAGSRPDKRMIQALESRGYTVDCFARQIQQSDFQNFDYIIVMDDQNFVDVCALGKNLSSKKAKVFRFIELLSNEKELEIPDPYYGTKSDFEHVINLLEDGTVGFRKYLDSKQKPIL